MEQKPMINPLNLQSFLVVAFVLAMLALVLGLFHSMKISAATSLATDWIGQYSQTSAALHNDLRMLNERMEKLEREVETLKAPSADALVPADSAAEPSGENP